MNSSLRSVRGGAIGLSVAILALLAWTQCVGGEDATRSQPEGPAPSLPRDHFVAADGVVSGNRWEVLGNIRDLGDVCVALRSRGRATRAGCFSIEGIQRTKHSPLRGAPRLSGYLVEKPPWIASPRDELWIVGVTAKRVVQLRLRPNGQAPILVSLHVIPGYPLKGYAAPLPKPMVDGTLDAIDATGAVLESEPYPQSVAVGPATAGLPPAE